MYAVLHSCGVIQLQLVTGQYLCSATKLCKGMIFVGCKNLTHIINLFLVFYDFFMRELSAYCLRSGAVVGLYLTRHSSYSFCGPDAASISFLCFSYPITSRRSRDDGKVQSSNRLKATYSYAQNTQHLIVIQGNCPHFNMKFPCNIFFLSVPGWL